MEITAILGAFSFLKYIEFYLNGPFETPSLKEDLPIGWNVASVLNLAARPTNSVQLSAETTSLPNLPSPFTTCPSSDLGTFATLELSAQRFPKILM